MSTHSKLGLYSVKHLLAFFFFCGAKSEFLFHFEKLYFQNGLKRSYSEIYCIFGLDSENAEFLFLTVISIEFWFYSPTFF